jgi:hypothetical protein
MTPAPQVYDDVCSILRIQQCECFRSPSNRPNLTYEVAPPSQRTSAHVQTHASRTYAWVCVHALTPSPVQRPAGSGCGPLLQTTLSTTRARTRARARLVSRRAGAAEAALGVRADDAHGRADQSVPGASTHAHTCTRTRARAVRRTPQWQNRREYGREGVHEGGIEQASGYRRERVRGGTASMASQRMPALDSAWSVAETVAGPSRHHLLPFEEGCRASECAAWRGAARPGRWGGCARLASSSGCGAGGEGARAKRDPSDAVSRALAPRTPGLQSSIPHPSPPGAYRLVHQTAGPRALIDSPLLRSFAMSRCYDDGAGVADKGAAGASA